MLDAFNKFSTVWAIQVFLFFTAAFTDNVGVQAREKLARKLVIIIIARITIEVGFLKKFALVISPFTNFAQFPGTV